MHLFMESCAGKVSEDLLVPSLNLTQVGFSIFQEIEPRPREVNWDK